METRIIFTFCASKGPTGRYGSRKFKSKIYTNYNIQGSTKDTNLFGWVQDHIGASLECKVKAAATRVVEESPFGALLSEHETRNIDLSQANEASRTTGTGSTTMVKGLASFNILSFFDALVAMNRREEISDSSNTRKQSNIAKHVSMVFLKSANYCVKGNSKRNKVGFMADLYPSLQTFNVWNPHDREMTGNLGMTFDVNLSFEGLWSFPPNSNGIYEWEFSNSRELKIFQRLPDTKEFSVEERVKTPFYINHNFSAEKFPELYKEFVDELEWHMAASTLVPPSLEVVLSNGPTQVTTLMAENTLGCPSAQVVLSNGPTQSTTPMAESTLVPPPLEVLLSNGPTWSTTPDLMAESTLVSPPPEVVLSKGRTQVTTPVAESTVVLPPPEVVLSNALTQATTLVVINMLVPPLPEGVSARQDARKEQGRP
ncbi:hypothetical protein R1sor_026328 [Riccia sorocarpa]|uniref:Uncharacterized protein n=1 Tax=Riccia sorocarpa TaxID=122646 RepID=A0ABD3GB38_9MARC